MKEFSDTFRFIEKENQEGNICFMVKQGGYHDYPDCILACCMPAAASSRQVTVRAGSRNVTKKHIRWNRGRAFL